MSDVRAQLPEAAARRIRTFSRYAWGFGAAGIMIAAFLVTPQIAVLDGRVYVAPDRGFSDRIFPYHEDSPVELQMRDGVITGDGQGGWLAFDADAQPIELRMTPTHGEVNATGEYINIFHSVDAAHLDDNPPSLAALWDPEDVVYATPALTDGRLWFSVADPNWEVKASPVQSSPIENGTAAGSGDAVLSYRGDALSARFTHSGAGFLRVLVYAPGQEQRDEPAVNDVDDFTTRASWPVAGTVLFTIESTGGEWSVTMDE